MSTSNRAAVHLSEPVQLPLLLVVTVEARLAPAVCIRPLSGMNAHMNHQPLFASKHFTTVWTGKGHPLPSVRSSPMPDPTGT